MGSKIAVVAMFSMAAMGINAYQGMKFIKPFTLDLMYTYAATSKDVFLKLRLPNSLPNIFTALKINTTTGLMAAICSEFFTSYAGIGYQISTQLKLSENTLAWSYITAAAIIGIAMYCMVVIAANIKLGWHPSARS